MAITKPSDIANCVGDFCPGGLYTTPFTAGSYTDTIRATEATADMAAVAGAADLSGAGNHASQSGGAANCMNLRVNPGNRHLGWQINTPPNEALPLAVVAPQWLENTGAVMSLNRRACSIYVVAETFNLRGSLHSYFSHGSAGSYLGTMFGTEVDGSGTVRLALYGRDGALAAQSRVCTTLAPHCSREIMSARSSTSSVILGLGDDYETLSPFTTNTTDTGFRIGAWLPASAGSERRAYGTIYRVVVFSRALNATEHADMVAYLRLAHHVPVYDKLVAAIGHSIWSGADLTVLQQFVTQLLDPCRAVGACVRLCSQPSRTLEGMLTTSTALTGADAAIAPHIRSRNFTRMVAITAAGTNNMAPIGAQTGAQAFAAWQALRAGVEGMGFRILATTDIDRNAGATWQGHAATLAGLIRNALPASQIADLAALPQIGAAGAYANTRLMVAPGIHPTPLGHTEYANAILAKLIPMLTSGGGRRRRAVA